MTLYIRLTIIKEIDMAESFYLKDDIATEIEVSNAMDGIGTLNDHFQIKLFYLGVKNSSNLYCEAEMLDRTYNQDRDIIERMFQAILRRSGLIDDINNRLLLKWMSIFGLASRNQRKLGHYEMILRYMPYDKEKRETLDKLFRREKTVRRKRKRLIYGKMVTDSIEHKVFGDNIPIKNAEQIIIILTCLHVYYSNHWNCLQRDHPCEEFNPDFISASGHRCLRATERWNEARRKEESFIEEYWEVN